MGKEIARHDLTDNRLHTIAVFGDFLHQLIHHDLVISLKLSTERISHQLLRQVSSHVCLALRDKSLQVLRISEGLATGEHTRSIDRTAGVVFRPPAANRVVVLQPETDRVENPMAGGTGRWEILRVDAGALIRRR